MKPVFWDDPDPRVRWGNPNLRWGDPSYLLEPGDEGYVVLQPGDPGYVPPAPPRPRRRGGAGLQLASAHEPDTDTDPMPTTPYAAATYQYIVQPTPTGERFMPRAQYRGTVGKADILAEVATRLGSQALTAELAIRTFLEVVIDYAKSGWKIEPIDDLLGFRLSCGGSFPDSTFPGTYANLQVAPNCNFGPAGLARAQDGFSGEKAGEQGRVSAVFVGVTDTFTGDADHYTPDKNLEIELANKRFKFDPADVAQWVKFKKSDGTMVAATEYYVAGSRIVARVPTPLTGNVELHLSCLINNSVRMTIYPHLLLP